MFVLVPFPLRTPVGLVAVTVAMRRGRRVVAFRRRPLHLRGALRDVGDAGLILWVWRVRVGVLVEGETEAKFRLALKLWMPMLVDAAV